MPGPPKRPTYLKMISGTERKDRAAPAGLDIPSLDHVPAPPDWLPNSHAVTEWHRLAPLLVANKLLAEADLSTFAHLCGVHGKMVQLWAAGEAPTAYLLSQYNVLAAAFGLSAQWRRKVGPGADKEKGGKFSKFKPKAVE